MSILAELQQRVQQTNALIAEGERVIASAKSPIPPAALANLQTLERLRKRLESEYMEVAQSQELEVYRYRLIPSEERATLSGVANAWGAFEEFFSTVYSAITRQAKTPKKKPPIAESISLGFGFAFTGSIGVVVTVPREKAFVTASPIRETSDIVFDLVEGKRISAHAKALGAEPVKALEKWFNVHLMNGMGLGLEWRSEFAVKRNVEVQVQQIARNREKLLSATHETELVVEGELYAVDTHAGEFKFSGNDGVLYIGRFTDAINLQHAASLPGLYSARIAKISMVVPVEGREAFEYVLRELSPYASLASGDEESTDPSL